ncbi:DUF551 domain-containing protein [Cupriavidus respiraculi]|uniref:DUF551 domain-containing protein n=1 Tax=Cupriavidus respiraculi TaxID=195930 RepID=A0ABM8XVJ2_9BURK|nr:DUF551 domain-containing protein [Cupriavidus respiraculi]CAG9184396.1 hypothetical protein LMG21510_05088 [Cupriavidus respiraculi]
MTNKPITNYPAPAHPHSGGLTEDKIRRLIEQHDPCGQSRRTYEYTRAIELATLARVAPSVPVVYPADVEEAHRNGYTEGFKAAERIYAASQPVGEAVATDSQRRVQPWMLACFGAEIAADVQERNHRFLEEALELVQACGATASEAHQLVDYVYRRPVGEKTQEVGGVMVTLAALCLAQGLDMHAAGETELARIWTKVEQIRAKQAAKPKHSPLPEHVPSVAQAGLPWVSVNDRLPPIGTGERVLVYTEGADFAGEQFFDIKADDLYPSPDGEQDARTEVAAAATHWMPLPLPGFAILARSGQPAQEG